MLPLLVFFEGSKINITKVAIFDNNMAVGKSKNLETLRPHDLTQPFFRGYSDFAVALLISQEQIRVVKIFKTL